MKRMMALTIVLSLLGVLIGCLDDIEEVALDPESDGISAPSGFNAQVSDGLIILRWRRVDGAAAYHLYRVSGDDSHPDRLSETADTFYADDDVQNGREYYYSVSAKGADGIEGERSVQIAAVPTAYSIIINGGEVYTGAGTVTLQLSAPITTVLMMIANDPGFSNGAWETYRFNRTWNLLEGDGSKTVYSLFRDANGSESPVMNDEITLDTYAEITGISVSPDPNPYTPGERIHLTMNVDGNESSGRASIMIEGYADEIHLADDGAGIYEADFTFPSSLRGTELGAVGSFIDRAGNQAPLFEADFTVSFTDPPDPVELVGVQDSTVGSITIRWIASAEEHFSHYAIYRDTDSGVDDDPILLVQELYNIAQTAYPDGGLIEGETYYYRIYVVNDLEESAGSNELTGHTADLNPNPVTLDPVSSIGDDRVTLTWSENRNTDFSEYRIYRSISPGVDLSSMLVTPLTDRQDTFYDDTGLNMSSFAYYYRVYVFDKGGKYSRSNEVTTLE